MKHPQRQQQLQQFIRKLGLPETAAVNWHQLDLALTHSSVSTANYEQLEFLGDAVLRLVAAEFLLEHYAASPVGELAAIRSSLVSDRTLSEISASYGLDRYLAVSGSAARDRAGRQSRLAEAFEAVVGALYLSTMDSSLIRPWLDSHFAQRATEIRADPALQNYKAALQEWTQAHHKQLPEYRVKEVCASHGSAERFEAEVWFKDECLGIGKGRSIKLAEQAAARAAFLHLTAPISDAGSASDIAGHPF